jgi:hypothetical protein
MCSVSCPPEEVTITMNFGSSAASVRDELVERAVNTWLFNPRPIQNEHQVRDV